MACSRNKVAVSGVKQADRERDTAEIRRKRERGRTENCGQEMEPVRARFATPAHPCSRCHDSLSLSLSLYLSLYSLAELRGQWRYAAEPLLETRYMHGATSAVVTKALAPGGYTSIRGRAREEPRDYVVAVAVRLQANVIMRCRLT